MAASGVAKCGVPTAEQTALTGTVPDVPARGQDWVVVVEGAAAVVVDVVWA
jgi:hypothetical protein